MMHISEKARKCDQLAGISKSFSSLFGRVWRLKGQQASPSPSGDPGPSSQPPACWAFGPFAWQPLQAADTELQPR